MRNKVNNVNSFTKKIKDIELLNIITNDWENYDIITNFWQIMTNKEWYFKYNSYINEWMSKNESLKICLNENIFKLKEDDLSLYVREFINLWKENQLLIDKEENIKKSKINYLKDNKNNIFLVDQVEEINKISHWEIPELKELSEKIKKNYSLMTNISSKYLKKNFDTIKNFDIWKINLFLDNIETDMDNLDEYDTNVEYIGKKWDDNIQKSLLFKDMILNFIDKVNNWELLIKEKKEEIEYWTFWNKVNIIEIWYKNEKDKTLIIKLNPWLLEIKESNNNENQEWFWIWLNDLNFKTNITNYLTERELSNKNIVDLVNLFIRDIKQTTLIIIIDSYLDKIK